ncbi:Hypothetical protein NTJ_15121 [Nesidiocoris tenuis]|uniref:Post-SET domain-containing protein n=1 Tax=Nesidiocoris tenuis TaxID=355587 RepID=A0ABN7BF14_9HEMI|nr:Hypothetical protein NTJ_15121 [Nesidiocoris tenuis]
MEKPIRNRFLFLIGRFPRSARCGEEIMRSGGSESRQGAKVSGNLGFPERQSRLDATRTRNSEEPKMRTVDEERRRRDICLCGSVKCANY